MFIISTLLFVSLAAVSESVMDKLQFHFERSVFARLKNKQWWNPKTSWRNKWKNGNKEEGEKFFLSSTIFVFTTDAWHLFKTIRNLFILLSFVSANLVFNTHPLWLTATVGASLWTLYSFVFEQSFSRLLEARRP